MVFKILKFKIKNTYLITLFKDLSSRISVIAYFNTKLFKIADNTSNKICKLSTPVISVEINKKLKPKNNLITILFKNFTVRPALRHV